MFRTVSYRFIRKVIVTFDDRVVFIVKVVELGTDIECVVFGNKSKMDESELGEVESDDSFDGESDGDESELDDSELDESGYEYKCPSSVILYGIQFGGVGVN